MNHRAAVMSPSVIELSLVYFYNCFSLYLITFRFIKLHIRRPLLVDKAADILTVFVAMAADCFSQACDWTGSCCLGTLVGRC